MANSFKADQETIAKIIEYYKYLQDELCERLGAKVRIKSNKIEISFVNGNDLNRLLEIMHIEPRG